MTSIYLDLKDKAQVDGEYDTHLIHKEIYFKHCVGPNGPERYDTGCFVGILFHLTLKHWIYDSPARPAIYVAAFDLEYWKHILVTHLLFVKIQQKDNITPRFYISPNIIYRFGPLVVTCETPLF